MFFGFLLLFRFGVLKLFNKTKLKDKKGELTMLSVLAGRSGIGGGASSSFGGAGGA